MIRPEIEKVVEPILRERLRKFGDFSRPGMSPEEFAMATAGELRPDLRRVSLLVSMVHAAAGDRIKGEGLELGCGYGFLLFPMALFNPNVHWTAVEHPDRKYFNRPLFSNHPFGNSGTPADGANQFCNGRNQPGANAGWITDCFVAKSGVAGKPYPAAKRQEHS